MLHRVALVRINFSEELFSAIIRVAKVSEPGTKFVIISHMA
jgi:hypothetical protein